MGPCGRSRARAKPEELPLDRGRSERGPLLSGCWYRSARFRRMLINELSAGKSPQVDRPEAKASHWLAASWPPLCAPDARRSRGDRASPSRRSQAVLYRELAVSPSAREIAVPGSSCWRASTRVRLRPQRQWLPRQRLPRRLRLFDTRPGTDRRTFERRPGTRQEVARPVPRDQWRVHERPELRIVSDHLWQRVQVSCVVAYAAVPWLL